MCAVRLLRGGWCVQCLYCGVVCDVCVMFGLRCLMCDGCCLVVCALLAGG